MRLQDQGSADLGSPCRHNYTECIGAVAQRFDKIIVHLLPLHNH